MSLYDFAAEVISPNDVETVTLAECIKAMRDRLDRVEKDPAEGGLDCFDFYDTMEAGT